MHWECSKQQALSQRQETADPITTPYLFTRSGLQEATSGYELTRVLRALDSAGALIKKESGKKMHRKRLPGGSTQGLYWIDPARLEDLG